jgi:hypothetical protein
MGKPNEDYVLFCVTCKQECAVPFKSWAFVFWFRHVWKWHQVIYL